MRERWEAYKHEECIFFKLLGPVYVTPQVGPYWGDALAHMLYRVWEE